MKMFIAAAAAMSLLSSPVLADDDHDCVSTGGTAKPVGEIVRMLEANGYSQIEELETDDGCYEVEARNAQGMRVDLQVHPSTGEILEVESDD